MSQVSRPMQIALLATVVLAAVWFVALRPKSSSGGATAAAPPPAVQSAPAASGGAAPGVSGLTRAIDKAHGGVATADGDAQRAAQSSADGTVPAGAPPVATAHAAPAHAPAAASAPSAARPHAPARPARPTRAATGHRTARRHAAHGPVAIVEAALKSHLAVAIAFVDDGTADARAVAQEMRFVPTFGGRAVVLSVPLGQLSAYDFITNAVQVTVAPTVVIVDRRGRATTIVGFADRGEIAQRLADAVAVRPAR